MNDAKATGGREKHRVGYDIETKQDDLIEGNETFQVRSAQWWNNKQGVWEGGIFYSCTVTIDDDDDDDITPPAITRVWISSDPGTDQTYARNDEIEVSVEFNGPVTVKSGTPRVVLDVGGVENIAEFDSGDGTTELTFLYTVQAGDSDTDGVIVGVGDEFVEGGTIVLSGTQYPVDLSHPATTFGSHKVDGGDEDVPVLDSASVATNGEELELSYNVKVRAFPIYLPPVGTFNVTIGANTASVDEVSTNTDGDGYVLSLSSFVRQGQTVVLAYTDPSGGNDFEAIQTRNGTDADSFTTGQGGVAAVVNNSTVTLPPAPALTATADNNGGVALSWTGGNGNSPFTRHQFRQKSTGNYGDWLNIPNSGAGEANVSGDTVPAGELTVGTVYTFQVRAVNGAGEGAASNDATATPADSVGPSPVSATVEAEGTTVELVFNEEYDYNAALYTSLTSFTVTADGNPVTVGAKTHDSSKKLFVRLLQLSPVVTQGQTVTVSYSDPTTGDDTSAVIQDNAGNDAPSFTVTAVNNSTVDVTPPMVLGAVIFEDPGADRVLIGFDEALDAASAPGASAFTATVDVTGRDVTGVSFTEGDTVVQLTLDSAVRAGEAVRVEYAKPAAGPLQDGAGNEVADFQVDVDNLLPAVAPYAPTNLTAAAGDGSVTLTWTPEADGGSAITKHQYREKEGTGSFGQWRDIPDSGEGEANASGYTVTGLLYGTVYTYRVRAVNALGESDPSNEAGTTTTGTATRPPAPTNLRALRHEGSVMLGWATPGHGGNAITRHQYQEKAGTDPFGDWTDIPDSGRGAPNANGYTLTGRTGGSYVYRVRAVNAVGESDPSNEASPVAATPPEAPVDLRVAPGDGSVKLDWRTYGDGGSPITKRQYRQKTTGAYGRWVDIPESAAGEANKFRYTVENLTNGRVYTSQVRAVNAVGESDPSAARSAIPGETALLEADVSDLDVDIGASGSYRIRLLPCLGRRLVQVQELDYYRYGVDPLKVDGEWPELRGERPEEIGGGGWPEFLELQCREDGKSPWTTVNYAATGIEDYRKGLRHIAQHSDPSVAQHFEPQERRLVHRVYLVPHYATETGEALWIYTGLHYQRADRDAEVTVWVVPPDAQPALRVGNAVGNETDGYLEFEVKLLPAADHRVTVDYATRDDNARAPGDYSATQGTLTFPPGETRKTVKVPLIDDSVEDNRELFHLVLSDATGGARIADGEGVGMIRNTDQEPLLKASFEDVPESHSGADAFTIRIAFSEAVSISAHDLLDHALEVRGGTATAARQVDGRADLWEITAQPDSNGRVSVLLTKPTDCDAHGAVCTADGRALLAGLAVQVPGPPLLSVADAQALEGPDATLDFVVTRGGVRSGTATVDYATANGTATAGSDYFPTSGTLTFQPGDRTKTVAVPVYDDTVPDDGETLTLTLSNASGAEIADGEATGTILNVEPNLPATGTPTTSGTPQVGGILRAVTSGIGDPNGMTDAVLGYQWVWSEGVEDTDISGATAWTYALGDSDLGRTVRVRVSFTDDAGFAESITSGPAGPVAPRPDEPAADVELVWSADMLVVEYTTVSVGAASADLFSNQGGSAGLQVQSLWYYAPGRELYLAFADVVPGEDDLTLQVGGIVLPLQPGDSNYTWEDVDVDWEDGQTVLARIVPAPTPTEPAPNSPATGAPTISGTAQVGETLAADTSGIADEGGLSDVVFAYQWIRNDGGQDADIQDATSSTYTPVNADIGKTVKVRVSFTDDDGNQESLTSEATAAVAATVPAQPLGLAVTEGDQARELDASWQAPASDGGSAVTGYKVQWKEIADSWDTADDVSEETATGTSHTITGLTGGVEYAVRVMASNGAGDGPPSAEATGTPAGGTSEQNTEPENNAATGLPTISGTAQMDETLTASTSDIADEDGLDNASFSYQWIAGDSDIPGAGSATYTVRDADVGKTIQVRVSFTDDAGNAESLTSDVTAEVAPKPNRAATGAPTISGTARVDETLTAATSGIADEDSLDNASFSYQWIAGDSDIPGAKSSTYTVRDADIGKTIKVRVSFTDDAGNKESLTSEATAAVAATEPTEPLTVSLENEATSHDGTGTFTFELRFSEEVKLSYKTLRDHSFTVTGGTVEKAKRLDKPSNVHWRITVEPDSNADVTVVLPVTTDCGDQGAICTMDGGRPLFNRLEFTVSGPGG